MHVSLIDQAVSVQNVLRWRSRTLGTIQIQQLEAAAKTLSELATLREKLETAAWEHDEEVSDQLALELIRLLQLPMDVNGVVKV